MYKLTDKQIKRLENINIERKALERNIEAVAEAHKNLAAGLFKREQQWWKDMQKEFGFAFLGRWHEMR